MQPTKSLACFGNSGLTFSVSLHHNDMIEWVPTQTWRIGLTGIAMQMGFVFHYLFTVNESWRQSQWKEIGTLIYALYVTTLFWAMLGGMLSFFIILKMTDTFFVSLLTFAFMVAGAASFPFLSHFPLTKKAPIWPWY